MDTVFTDALLALASDTRLSVADCLHLDVLIPAALQQKLAETLTSAVDAARMTTEESEARAYAEGFAHGLRAAEDAEAGMAALTPPAAG